MNWKSLAKNPITRLLVSGSALTAGVLVASFTPENAKTITLITTSLFQILGNIGVEIFGAAFDEKFINNTSRDEILKNGDLTRAVGLAIFTLFDAASKEKKYDSPELFYGDDAERLEKISKSSTEIWEEIVLHIETKENPRLVLSDSEIEELSVNKLTQYFRAKENQIDSLTALSPIEWDKIILTLAEKNGLLLEYKTRKELSQKLYHEFPRALRKVLVNDFEHNGKAFASMQLRLFGEGLDYAIETNQIVKEVKQDTTEIKRIVNLLLNSSLVSNTFNFEQFQKVIDLLSRLDNTKKTGDPNAIFKYEFERCKTLIWLRKEVDMNDGYHFLPMVKTTYNEAIVNNAGENADGYFSAEFGSLSENQKKILLSLEYVDKFSIFQVFTNFKGVVESRLSQSARDKLVYSEIPKFLLLGEPGSGKSAFCKYLAFHCQNQLSPKSTSGSQTEFQLISKSKKPYIPVYIKLPDWEEWAIKNDFKLQNYLVKSLYESVDQAPTAEQWKNLFGSGEVLLLLDGLDEILNKNNSSGRIADEINKKAPCCPTIITCRTFSYNTHKSNFSSYPIFSLGGLMPAQQDEIIKKYTGVNDFNLKKIRRQLDESPEISVLAQNTLLLTIICFIISFNKTKEEISLPKTRTQLYFQAINKLLDKEIWNRYPPQRTCLEIEEYKTILAELAFDLWTSTDQRKISFKGSEIRKKLNKLLDSEELKYLRTAVTPENLVDDYSRYGGILVGEIEQPYVFLHLTFFEYLVAYALAGKPNYLETVNERLYHPSWNFVLMLLGGTLLELKENELKEKDPEAYIQHLLSKDLGNQRRPFFKAVAAAVEANSPQLPKLAKELYDLKIKDSQTSSINKVLLDKALKLVSKYIWEIISVELQENKNKNRVARVVQILKTIFSPYISDEIREFMAKIDGDPKFQTTRILLENLVRKMEAS
jgi:hypothetical protein